MSKQAAGTELGWTDLEDSGGLGKVTGKLRMMHHNDVSMASRQFKVANTGRLCQDLLVQVEEQLLHSESDNCKLLSETHLVYLCVASRMGTDQFWQKFSVRRHLWQCISNALLPIGSVCIMTNLNFPAAVSLSPLFFMFPSEHKNHYFFLLSSNLHSSEASFCVSHIPSQSSAVWWECQHCLFCYILFWRSMFHLQVRDPDQEQYFSWGLFNAEQEERVQTFWSEVH